MFPFVMFLIHTAVNVKDFRVLVCDAVLSGRSLGTNTWQELEGLFKAVYTENLGGFMLLRH